MPVGLFGEQRKTTCGSCGAHLRDRGLDGQVEGRAALSAQPVDPRAADRAADDRVHGVGRREAERRASRAGEREGDVLEHLVGTVAGPHLGHVDRGARRRQVCREGSAQLGELAIGVAVQVGRHGGDRRGDLGHDGRRHGVGVLVGVEAHGHIELRCAVRLFAAEVGTEQSGDATVLGEQARGHRSDHPCPKRTWTASPWAGRSSACASVTTWWATSSSAASE